MLLILEIFQDKLYWTETCALIIKLFALKTRNSNLFVQGHHKVLPRINSVTTKYKKI